MYPVFRHMVRSFKLEQCMAEQVRSLEAMFKVLDLLLTGRSAPGDAQRLRRAMVGAESQAGVLGGHPGS